KKKKNDFLYGNTLAVKTAENAAVHFTMNHKMARITVNVKYSTQFTGTESITNFKINVLPTVSIDLNTGTLGKASGEKTAISLGKVGKATEGYLSTYDVIVVPQRVTEAERLLSLSINGKELGLSLTKEF
ncbi:MAG: fimbrillin family protein, partial [Odoribacter sp.]|nr:fimbrillin family protein [Odoribacter sp.]